jgi:hypothetical protein
MERTNLVDTPLSPDEEIEDVITHDPGEFRVPVPETPYSRVPDAELREMASDIQEELDQRSPESYGEQLADKYLFESLRGYDPLGGQTEIHMRMLAQGFIHMIELLGGTVRKQTAYTTKIDKGLGATGLHNRTESRIYFSCPVLGKGVATVYGYHKEDVEDSRFNLELSRYRWSRVEYAVRSDNPQMVLEDLAEHLAAR